MQKTTKAKPRPAVGIVFDSDMGNSIDDVLALSLLYGLDGKGEVRVASVSVSKNNLKAAALAEILGRFYFGAYNAKPSPFIRVLPVGMSVEGKSPEDTPLMDAVLAKMNDSAAPAFPHSVHKLTDTADVLPQLRNALSAQHDQNAIVVVSGPATNLAALLDVRGARDLIEAKVRFLSIMGGAYPSGDPEYNIKLDIAAAKRVFAEWPTPIVASGFEVGKELLFPASSIEKDFAWTAHHPVVEAYKAYKPMPYDAPCWDLTSVLYAARPLEGYFKVSEPGRIEVSDDGRTQFTPATGGKHRHLIYDPAQKDRIMKVFTEMVSSKPVPKLPKKLMVDEVEDKPAEQPKPPADGKTPPLIK
jgi:inosine-uridine nucleoside N-ribohydrolase